MREQHAAAAKLVKIRRRWKMRAGVRGVAEINAVRAQVVRDEQQNVVGLRLGRRNRREQRHKNERGKKPLPGGSENRVHV